MTNAAEGEVQVEKSKKSRVDGLDTSYSVPTKYPYLSA